MTSATFSQISQLVKQCLRLGDQDSSLIDASLQQLESSQIADINEFFDKHETELAPLLYWHLKQRGLTASLTTELRNLLQYSLCKNISRNLLLEQRLKEVLERCSDQGIEVVLLKGASVFASCFSFFKDAYVMADLDLLVKPVDMDRAEQVLINSGYRSTQRIELNGWVKHSLLGPDNFTPIDLHSSLFWTGTVSNYWDYVNSDLWSASVRVSLGEVPVRLLSAEDQVAYRLVHDVIGHGYSLLLTSIARLYQFCLLIHQNRETIDWIQFLTNLRTKGTDRLLTAYMEYGRRELGLSIPSRIGPIRHDSVIDLAYLDAPVRCPARLRDAAYRASIMLLTSGLPGARRIQMWRGFIRHCIMVPLRHGRRTGLGTLKTLIYVVKVTLLQLLSLRYFINQRTCHSESGGPGYVE